MYDSVIVDCSNLFYRLCSNEKDSKEAARTMIRFIEEEVSHNTSEDGIIWLTFDHLSYDDVGIDRAFENGIIRNDVQSSYKKGRKHSKIFRSTIELFRKYFYYSGPRYRLVYGEHYEADDFVKAIMQKTGPDKKVAFVTTDEDWCRYLTPNVSIINRGFDDPWREQEFIDKYKFKPTEATVIFYKALFGDSSDNIKGALFSTRAYFSDEMGDLCLAYLQELGENGTPYEEAKKEFIDTSHTNITLKFYDDLSTKEKLFYQFEVINLRARNFQHLKQYLKLLETLVKKEQLAKYTYFTPKKDERYDVIKNAIIGVDLKNRLGHYK